MLPIQVHLRPIVAAHHRLEPSPLGFRPDVAHRVGHALNCLACQVEATLAVAGMPASASGKKLSAGGSPIELPFDSSARVVHDGIARGQGFGATDEELGFGHGDGRVGAR